MHMDDFKLLSESFAIRHNNFGHRGAPYDGQLNIDTTSRVLHDSLVHTPVRQCKEVVLPFDATQLTIQPSGVEQRDILLCDVALDISRVGKWRRVDLGLTDVTLRMTIEVRADRRPGISTGTKVAWIVCDSGGYRRTWSERRLVCCL